MGLGSGILVPDMDISMRSAAMFPRRIGCGLLTSSLCAKQKSQLVELSFLSPAALTLASQKLSSIVELELRQIGKVCAGLSAELHNSG
ncbi:hypothetical protein VOM14_04830 [Paraburkholderia sp. MPAMCS5]|uniref:hypothetical protein n=1 Tax=Paraburkholderia sp. MPAMCS5 TaxID=3112563 RepID=UPI002E185848|nr:hypothetical protein [Paraburkholderia sp. MPAMCS5]